MILLLVNIYWFKFQIEYKFSIVVIVINAAVNHWNKKNVFKWLLFNLHIIFINISYLSYGSRAKFLCRS